jgi:hypothetical protein
MPSFFDTTLHIALPEFIFIVLGIVIIGFAMGFLWTHRKGGEEALKLKLKKEEDESDKWRLKYYDQIEVNEKQTGEQNQQIQTLTEKEEQLAVEVEELTLLNQQLMLKQKNNAAQQNVLVQELDILKNNLQEKENIISQLKEEKNSSIDPELIQSLQQELARTARLEQMIAGKMNQTSPVNEVILEGLSEWGAHQLRQELRKLAQKNSYLESQLARLGQYEESSQNGVSKKTD